MNILHVTNNYPSDKFPIFGIFVKEQIDSLNYIGEENDVFFIDGRSKGKLEYIKALWRLRKVTLTKNYDIIHCHHALSALCLIFSGCFINNKIVVSFQNDPVHEFGVFLFKFITFFTDGWIFKNNSKFISNEYSFYLPNGVNFDFFKDINQAEARKKINLDFDKIYILFVSSNKIRVQKRYDIFTEVLQLLKVKYNYKNIEEVKIINVERENIPFYLNAVNLHLLTSDFEGSPNSVKECMACNTSVVSTDVGNVKELLSNVKGSYVSTNNSSDELAMLVDKSIKDNICNGRIELAKQKLEINQVAEKLVTIYNKVINKK